MNILGKILMSDWFNIPATAIGLLAGWYIISLALVYSLIPLLFIYWIAGTEK